MSSPQIVFQKPKRPGLRIALVAAATALAVMVAWGLFTIAQRAFEDDVERNRRDIDGLLEVRKSLTQQLRTAQGENKELRDELAFLRQTQQVESEATGLLRAELSELQRDIIELREQLAFYRGIVSPDVVKAGVRVHSLKLAPTGAGPRYRYELVLVQAVRRQSSAAGHYELVVEGVRDGKPLTVNWGQLRDGGDAVRRYGFQYFQEFDGMLLLPLGFKPQRIRVQLIPDGSAPAVEEVIEWRRAVMSPDNAER